MVNKFTIFSKDNCVWCEKTVSLLKEKGFTYEELKLNTDYTKDQLSKILNEPDKITLPKIFLRNKLIGGYEELLIYFEEHGI